MSQKLWENSQKNWEGRTMTYVEEASASLRLLAGPMRIGDRIKARISRAARASGLTYWRAYDIWYGKARRLDAAEMEAIRCAAKIQRGRHDDLAMAAGFEALAQRLSTMDADTGGPEARAMRALAEQLRNLAAEG